MEPLFETETLYTFEEHKKMNKIFRKKVSKYNLLICISLITFGLALAIMLFIKRYDLAFIILLVIAAFIVTNVLKVKITVKRAWESNQLAHNRQIRFLFFDHHFEINNSQGNSRIFYNQIYKILETDTNVYIFPSNLQGYVINKANCPAEFSAFIQRIKSEYKK